MLEGGLDWPRADEAGDGCVEGRQSLFYFLKKKKNTAVCSPITYNKSFKTQFRP